MNEAAVQLSRQALVAGENGPHAAAAAYHAGRLLIQALGRIEEGRALLTELIQRDPDGGFSAQAQDLLGRLETD